MRIFVLGAGATGSLLAQLLERQGHNVWCGDRDPERARRFLDRRSPIPETEADALALGWQPLAAFTMPLRARPFTSGTAIVLLVPMNLRRRSGSRSAHQQ